MKQTISGSTLRTPTPRARTCSAARRFSRARRRAAADTRPSSSGLHRPRQVLCRRTELGMISQGAPGLRLGGTQGRSAQSPGRDRPRPGRRKRPQPPPSPPGAASRQPGKRPAAPAPAASPAAAARVDDERRCGSSQPSAIATEVATTASREPAEDARTHGQARGQQTERGGRDQPDQQPAAEARCIVGRPRTSRTSRRTSRAVDPGSRAGERWPSTSPYAASAVQTAQSEAHRTERCDQRQSDSTSPAPYRAARRASASIHSTPRQASSTPASRQPQPSGPPSSQLIGSPPSR